MLTVNPLYILKQLLEIEDVLPHNARHIFQHRQLVAIVLQEHAFRTYHQIALFTEVLNRLVRVLPTCHILRLIVIRR